MSTDDERELDALEREYAQDMMSLAYTSTATSTYLDDPDHMWVIDPAAVEADDVEAVQRLGADIRSTTLSYADKKLIIDGVIGLLARKAGTVGECVRTSLIWFFG